MLSEEGTKAEQATAEELASVMEMLSEVRGRSHVVRNRVDIVVNTIVGQAPSGTEKPYNEKSKPTSITDNMREDIEDIAMNLGNIMESVNRL